MESVLDQRFADLQAEKKQWKAVPQSTFLFSPIQMYIVLLPGLLCEVFLKSIIIK